jgi:RNA polymerase sigma-70 factor (ECF subfamily)
MMHAVENESQLVAEACLGSPRAFEALVKTYESPVKRMLYGMTQDVHCTQDLCQETFLAAYRALPRMNSKELRFAPWLYRIALNLVRSQWRQRKRITFISFSTSWGGNEDQFEELIEDGLVNEDRFEERIVKQDLVRRVLAQLPAPSALCLLLDAEGFTYREIAELLHDSLPAVRSRLARARQGFQRIYSNLDREER